MDLSILKIFLIATIVQFCRSVEAAKNNANSPSTFLQDIIKEQQAAALEKQQQKQTGPQSYLDKVMTSTSKGSESEGTPTKGAKNKAVKVDIPEAKTVVQVTH